MNKNKNKNIKNLKIEVNKLSIEEWEKEYIRKMNVECICNIDENKCDSNFHKNNKNVIMNCICYTSNEECKNNVHYCICDISTSKCKSEE